MGQEKPFDKQYCFIVLTNHSSALGSKVIDLMKVRGSKSKPITGISQQFGISRYACKHTKLIFEPSADRSQVNVSAQAVAKLQPCNAVQTALYCGKDIQSGNIQAVELVPNIPGQINMDGGEQEQPKELKICVGGN